MSGHATELEKQVERRWFWFAIALFLLLPLDLFTTLIAVGRYGIAVEANPIMRWLLQQGLVAVTAANLVVVGCVVYLFHAALNRIQHVQPSHRHAFIRLVDVWIGLLIIAGIVLVTNNMLTLV